MDPAPVVGKVARLWHVLPEARGAEHGQVDRGRKVAVIGIEQAAEENVPGLLVLR